MFWNQPLRDPTAQGGGAATATQTQQTGADGVNLGPGANGSRGQGSSINLDTTVTAGGEAFTINQLLTAKRELDSMRGEKGELTSLRALKDAVKLVMPDDGAEVGVDVSERAMRTVLAGVDWKGNVDQFISDTYRQVEGSGQQVAGAQAAANVAQNGAVNGQATSELADTNASVNHQGRLLQEVLRDRLRTKTAEAVLNDPMLNKFIKVIKEREGDKGEEDVAKVRAGWSDQIYQGLISAVARKKDAIGGDLDMRWIDEVAPEVVKQVADKARLLIGDPNQIGRGSSMPGGEDPFKAILEREAATMPKYDPDNPHDPKFDSKVVDFATDVLSRAAANADRGEGTVA